MIALDILSNIEPSLMIVGFTVQTEHPEAPQWHWLTCNALSCTIPTGRHQTVVQSSVSCIETPIQAWIAVAPGSICVYVVKGSLPDIAGSYASDLQWRHHSIKQGRLWKTVCNANDLISRLILRVGRVWRAVLNAWDSRSAQSQALTFIAYCLGDNLKWEGTPVAWGSRDASRPRKLLKSEEWWMRKILEDIHCWSSVIAVPYRPFDGRQKSSTPQKIP